MIFFFLEELDILTTVNALKGSLYKTTLLWGIPVIRVPFFFLVYEEKGNAHNILIIKHRPHY